MTAGGVEEAGQVAKEVAALEVGLAEESVAQIGRGIRPWVRTRSCPRAPRVLCSTPVSSPNTTLYARLCTLWPPRRHSPPARSNTLR